MNELMVGQMKYFPFYAFLFVSNFHKRILLNTSGWLKTVLPFSKTKRDKMSEQKKKSEKSSDFSTDYSKC